MDGVGDYTTGLPFYEKAIGKGNVVMMPWADFGFDMYRMSIMASEKTMKERPKVLRAFLEASYMGWRDVMADPKAALAIFKKRVPEIDLVDHRAQHDARPRPDEAPSDYAKNGIGWIDEKKMCDSVDLVNTYMGLPKKVECKDVYTTEFLTKVAMPVATEAERGDRQPQWPRARPLIELDEVGMIYEADERPGRGACAASRSTVGARRVRLAGRARAAAASRPCCASSRACGRRRRARVVVDGAPVREPDSRRRHGVPGAGAAEVAQRARQRAAAGGARRASNPARYRERALELLAAGRPRRLRREAAAASCPAACSSAPRCAAPCCSIRRSC